MYGLHMQEKRNMPVEQDMYVINLSIKSNALIFLAKKSKSSTKNSSFLVCNTFKILVPHFLPMLLVYNNGAHILFLT